MIGIINNTSDYRIFIFRLFKIELPGHLKNPDNRALNGPRLNSCAPSTPVIKGAFLQNLQIKFFFFLDQQQHHMVYHGILAYNLCSMTN